MKSLENIKVVKEECTCEIEIYGMQILMISEGNGGRKETPLREEHKLNLKIE